MPGKRMPPPTVRVGWHCVATGEERIGELPPEEAMIKGITAFCRGFGAIVTVVKKEKESASTA